MEEITKIATAYKMEVAQVEALVSKDDIAADVRVSKAATLVKDNAEFKTKSAQKAETAETTEE